MKITTIRRTAVAMVVLVSITGCSGSKKKTSTGAKSSPSASPSPSPSPSPRTAEEIIQSILPAGYSAGPLDPQLQTEVDSTMKSELSKEPTLAGAKFEFREISKGAEPVATLLVVVPEEPFTSADRADVVKGFTEESGATPEPAELGKTDGSLVQMGDGVEALIFTTSDYALFLFGPDRNELVAIGKGAAGAL